jgi:drug/metabolite transporter (DMT)-like permease
VNKKQIALYIYGSALLYSIITGLSFIFGKLALEVAKPLDMLAYRFFVSFLTVILLITLRVVKLNLTVKKVIKIIPLALLYPIMFFTFQSYGLANATAIEAGIITAAIPIFTLILATLFLKEQTTTLQRLSILISVAGVIYITLMKNRNFELSGFKGTFFILLSALSFAAYSVLAKSLTKEFSSKELTFTMVLLSCFILPVIVVLKHILSGSVSSFVTPLKSGKFLISVLYLGILSTLATSFLTNFILSKIEASKMSVFVNLGTIVTVIAGVIILNERLFYYHIIGAIFIVGGVLGTNFLDRLNKK